MGDSKTTIIKTELGPVTVRKMPLKDYGELLRALNKLPEKVGSLYDGRANLDDLGYSDMLKMIFPLLADAWSDVAAIVAVPTDKDEAFLLKLDGADAFDIIGAIFELNDFARIWAAIKKMRAPKAAASPEPTKPAAPATPPETT